MIAIDDFGIREGISEVILTTLSADGVPNAAPMGLHRTKSRLFIRIYRSKTLDNLLTNPAAAANIVDDPVLFVQSSLSDLEPEKFEFIEEVPVLRNVQGWIICECTCSRGENVSVVDLFPLKGRILDPKIHPVSRGFNAVIEAAIHATRFIAVGDKKSLDSIEYCHSIVQKCGGAREKEAMHLLFDLMGRGT